MSDVTVNVDTIVAPATAWGRGAIGMVRVSGKNVRLIAERLLGKLPPPRVATYAKFKSSDHQILDIGIALFFPSPNSFTGEDLLELQGHGSPIVINQLVSEIVAIGARIARPGEFSERAFLNGKIDLAQAEAIADLIESSTEKAAQGAVRSLQGEFSSQIQHFVEELTYLRVYVEAALDFPDEEIDFLTQGSIQQRIEHLKEKIHKILMVARQGVVLKEGLNMVLAGAPNAGKSSLLNALSGVERAIVTEIPGTTRDVMRETISMDGIPLHIIDTAGLRDTHDIVEQEGIKRALTEIQQADHLLFVFDAPRESLEDVYQNPEWQRCLNTISKKTSVTLIQNKIDLINEKSKIIALDNGFYVVKLSAKTKSGIDLLINHIKKMAGMQSSAEGVFLARTRHLEALKTADHYLVQALTQFNSAKIAAELIAEDLRMAQVALSEITGKISSDELLGKIFSSFCIGK